MDIEINHINKNKVPLIIAFGGMAGNLSEPVYEFKNFLSKNFNCNLIFIKDSNKCWYFQGIRGIGNTVDQSVITLRKIVNNISHSKVISIGTSAGGYASILFGILLKVDNIISFSPQTFLDRKNRRQMNDKSRRGYIKKLYKMDVNNSKKYFDLLKLDNKAVHRITIVYGYKNETDMKHVNRMKIWKNVHIRKFEGGHLLVKKLRDNGILYNILNRHINEK